MSEEFEENYYLNINHYNDDRFNQSILHLDYNNLYKSSYLLDQYYPNIFSDYSMYGLKVTGVMDAPIFQVIPEKIFFDINKEGKISQLSYHEKKSYDYFDTKIALKIDLNDKVRFLGFAESKSLNKNINQNYLLNVNKKTNNGILNISYMYHIDDAPIEYMNQSVHDGCSVENYYGFSYVGNALPENCKYQSFQKNNETFLFGFDYQYKYDKWNLYHNSAFQVSNTNKEYDQNITFDENYKWNNLLLSFAFNPRGNIFFENQYKKSLIEFPNILSDNDFYQNILTIGFDYTLLNDFFIKLNYDVLGSSSHDYNRSFNMLVKYIKPSHSIEVGLDTDIQSEFLLSKDVEDGYNIFYSTYTKKYIKFNAISNRFETSFEFGDLDVKYKDETRLSLLQEGGGNSKVIYPYALYNAKLRFHSFSLDLKYNFYDSDFTYINEYAELGFSYSPIIKNVRFRPYGKILFNSITFNSLYEINLLNYQMFVFSDDYVNTLFDDDHTVNIVKAELGFMFDSFKITYKIMNPFKERFNYEVQYGKNLLPHLGKHHTINVTWIFQD